QPTQDLLSAVTLLRTPVMNPADGAHDAGDVRQLVASTDRLHAERVEGVVGGRDQFGRARRIETLQRLGYGVRHGCAIFDRQPEELLDEPRIFEPAESADGCLCHPTVAARGHGPQNRRTGPCLLRVEYGGWLDADGLDVRRRVGRRRPRRAGQSRKRERQHGSRRGGESHRRPEYSSICVVRSSGYEMWTSVMWPWPSRTASSRGCTNPV